MAQQQRKPGQASSLGNFYKILAVIAALGVVAIAVVVMRGRSGKAATEPIAVAGADDPQALVEKARGVVVGKDDAPAKLLVFSDYMCPFCASFASQIEPLLVSEYVNAGKLQLVYYDFPLGGAHKYSFLAARAARCAGDQDKFWEYHDMLFGKQSEWSYEQKPPVSTFIDYGSQLGLDKNSFGRCVQSDRYADVVSANHLLGERLAVGATPTLFMNGRKLPVEMLELGKLRELIDNTVGVSQ